MQNFIIKAENIALTIDPTELSEYLTLPFIVPSEDSSGKMTVSVECWHKYIDGHILHPDYCFNEIASRLAVSLNHQSNLLAIVAQQVEFRWKSAISLAYNEQSKGNPSPDFVDLDLEGLSRLETLYNLLTIKESYIGGLEVLLNPKSVVKNEKYSKRGPLLKDFQVRISHDDLLKKGLVNYLIKFYLEDLASPIFEYIYFQIPKGEELTASNISKLINNLTPKFTEEELHHRFVKEICITVLKYLNNEVVIDKKEVQLSQAEGVLIYSLLLLFNLISSELHDQHDSDRKKANYISTFLKKDPKSRERNFPELNIKF